MKIALVNLNKLFLLFLAASLGACAGLERQQAAGTEKLLAAAGFQRRPADSAERRQDLASLPMRQMVARHEGAKTLYTYADAQNCGCLYVGGPEAYERYREFEASEEIAQNMNAEFLNPSMGSDLWESSPLQP
jgi:hypothetical protein